MDLEFYTMSSEGVAHYSLHRPRTRGALAPRNQIQALEFVPLVQWVREHNIFQVFLTVLMFPTKTVLTVLITEIVLTVFDISY